MTIWSTVHNSLEQGFEPTAVPRCSISGSFEKTPNTLGNLQFLKTWSNSQETPISDTLLLEQLFQNSKLRNVTNPTAAFGYCAKLVVSDFWISLSNISLTRLKPAILYCEFIKNYINQSANICTTLTTVGEVLHFCQQQHWKNSVPIGSEPSKIQNMGYPTWNSHQIHLLMCVIGEFWWVDLIGPQISVLFG